MNAQRVRHAGCGFTLIELLAVLALAALLAAVAYPAYRGVVHKTRRAEALAALLQLQLAQERHRANHASYGGLADLGLAAVTPQGHYTLAVVATSPSGYQLLASAHGLQQGDTACRHLKLTLAGGDITHHSGPDAQTANPEAANRRCWAQ